MMKIESGISLCVDIFGERPKADMSKLNKIRVNGKEYVSIDLVLEIVDNTIRAASLSGINRNLTLLGTLIEVKDEFLALKGEQG